MKYKLFILLILILLHSGNAQVIESNLENNSSARIELEEEEIILYENGKEIKKILCSRWGGERRKIDNDLREMIKKAKDKQLYLKNIPLQEPRVRFIDDKNNTIKEIKVGASKKDWVISNRTIKKQINNAKEMKLVKEMRFRSANVSEVKNYVLIVETVSDLQLPETEEQKIAVDGTDAYSSVASSNVKYYDIKGSLLWEKQMPKGCVSMARNFSEDGKVIAIVKHFDENIYFTSDKPYHQLIVYNNNGDSIYVFPKTRKGNEWLRLSTNIDMSPNGQYISIGAHDFQCFFNINNQKYWESSIKYNPYKIENDGITQASYYDTNTNKIVGDTIDLKIYLGK